MKKESFEEKGLNEVIREIEILHSEIAAELALIQSQLEIKGRWDNFMEEAGNVEMKGNFILTGEPESCYESLYLVFIAVEHYENLLAKVEETRLLDGSDMESIGIPDETLTMLANLGISIEPGPAHAPKVQLKNLQETISACYLASLKIRTIMEKALRNLRTSRKDILEKFL